MSGWRFAESHLMPDAVVALVDGELSPSAHDRATAHLARCPGCAAEVTAQRQAVAAVKDAGAPPMSAGFLASLRSIPEHTDLPGAPDNLAVTADGQLVAIQRPDRVAGLRDAGVLGGAAPLGTTAPLGHSATVLGGGRFAFSRKRAAQGAGVVVSGLVLSALALVGTAADSGEGTGGGGPVRTPNANLLPANMNVPRTSAAPVSSAPVSSEPEAPDGARSVVGAAVAAR
ncbi:anti-sigma factor family protein [Amycolatopsis echigonensis]|uniref:Zf-HC2 domain-containing protein n=1 Tax=Amycolatopsis echigonensis TaxID=2576905 RepID=A0A8E2B810_9PSEU|nr:zf-HC2 domain-containing protein [Amycolatopsis echigonensis]MBB2503970.1 zf-HC2 domain-containing protein [Amycolatopsis echigonensis]